MAGGARIHITESCGKEAKVAGVGRLAMHLVNQPLALIAAAVGEAVHAPATAHISAKNALVQATIVVPR